MRLRYNNSAGTLGALLSSGGTTITFASAPSFATIVSPDYIPLVLDPPQGATPNPSFEIVYLTAYTSGGTSGTITRGQEGTSGVGHNNGSVWAMAPTTLDPDRTQRASSIIATAQSTTSTSYVKLTTPDQVTGITMPTNGLMAVWFQGLWSEQAINDARAAIFLNSGSGDQQLFMADSAQLTDNVPQAAAIGSNLGVGINAPLVSAPNGLISQEGTGMLEVTTGQALGVGGVSGYSWESAGTQYNVYGGPYIPGVGGPCYIFAAAGVYTISVQFKSVGGHTVQAQNRKLWVEAKPFP